MEDVGHLRATASGTRSIWLHRAAARSDRWPRNWSARFRAAAVGGATWGWAIAGPPGYLEITGGPKLWTIEIVVVVAPARPQLSATCPAGENTLHRQTDGGLTRSAAREAFYFRERMSDSVAREQ